MVSREDREVYEAVLERDRLMTWLARDEKPHRLQAWLMTDPWVCAMPLIAPSRDLSPALWGLCSGEMQRDHVHVHAGGTKAKRADTTMETLVILCRHHHLNGWATSHRPEIRQYIKEANERYRNHKDSGRA